MTTIALVDDENSIRTSVSLALESEGFKVDVFQNGLEALEALEGEASQAFTAYNKAYHNKP